MTTVEHRVHAPCTVPTAASSAARVSNGVQDGQVKQEGRHVGQFADWQEQA
jgi:hypothetical protein